MKRKNYIADIIGKDYLNWKHGDNVLIAAPCESGKTTFITHYARENRKQRILYLCNRKNLKKQVEKTAEKINNIYLLTYQTIEDTKAFDFSVYDTIICDECHYFLTDASFNARTEKSLKAIAAQTGKLRIYMTATPENFLRITAEYEINFNYRYTLPSNYEYIEHIYSFNNLNTIQHIIPQKSDEAPIQKQIVFLNDIAKARKLKLAYQQQGYSVVFLNAKNINTSKTAKKTAENITSREFFEEDILICTSVLDCGVNINDRAVRNVVICDTDIEEVIQMLGRVRVWHDGIHDNINLYFFNPKGNIWPCWRNSTESILNKISDTTDKYDGDADVGKFYTRNGNFLKLRYKALCLKSEFLKTIRKPSDYEKILKERLGVDFVENYETTNVLSNITNVLRKWCDKIINSDNNALFKKELTDAGYDNKNERTTIKIGTLLNFIEQNDLPFNVMPFQKQVHGIRQRYFVIARI